MRPTSSSPFPFAPSLETPGSLELAMAGGKVGLWDWDLVTQEVKWTDAVYMIHGVDPATFEVSVENFTHLIHPDDRARVQAAIQRTLEQDAPYELEFRIHRPDGKEAWIFTNGTVVRHDGVPLRMIGATLDITARRHADDTSRWLAAIVDSSDDAILSKDLNSIITSWNVGAERLFGYTAREVIGRPVTILVPAGRKDEEFTLLQRIHLDEHIAHYETVRQRKDGTLVHVSLTVSPIKDARGHIVGASKIVRDISERKKAQEALHLSEERFRLLASHAPVGIFLSDQGGGCVFVNERWCEMAGLSLAQAQGGGWSSALHPDDRERVFTEWHRAVRLGNPSLSEFRFQRPDGRIVWVEGSAVQFNDGGRFQGYLGSCIDVTQRKKSELQSAFLHTLSDQVSGMNQPEQIMETSQAALGKFLGADRCYFFEVDHERVMARVSRDWHRPGLPSLAGSHRMADFGSAELVTLLAQTRCQVSDVLADPATRDHASSYAPLCMRSFAASAWWQDGRWHLSLALASREPREWSPAEMELLENVAARVGPIIEQTRAMHAMRESERLYRAIGESIDYGIWVCDATGRNLYASESFLKLVGLTQQQFSDHGWVDVLHPDEIEATTAAWRKCSHEGAFWEREHRFKGVDGGWHPVLARGVALRDDAGRIKCWVGINLDISALKEVQKTSRQRELQLRLVTDHAPIFLAHCDREHRFKFVNQPYVERYNRRREDIIGRHVSDLTGAEAYATFRQHMDAALAGRRIEFEQEIPYTTLGRRWVHVIYEPERTVEGEVIGLVAVIVDITTRKQAELELERARDAALAAGRAKDDFLAALSHELRTPLNPVLLLASDASKNPDLPKEIRESFEMIRVNINLEARLIDDLLDHTRITQGKMLIEQQHVDLHAVLRDAVATIHAQIDAKRLNLQLLLAVEPPIVLGDPLRLQQVFWNILQNAVKFTPEGGKVCVMTRIPAGTEQVAVEITDTGIGMSPAELAGMFQPFTQGDHAAGSGSRQFGGLGLGLAISRKLVEMHGGRIHAASPGRQRGSVLVIELPLAPAGAKPTIIPAGSNPAHENPAAGPAGSILLVEDHASTRETLHKLLARRNYEVLSAGTVTDARALAATRAFDFLVSDVGLPDGDGYQLMTEVRKLRPAIQGIALSGYGMDDDLERSHAAGFSTHLVKPVSISSLEKALTRLTQPVTTT